MVTANVQTQIGDFIAASGLGILRQSNFGALVVTELHGRFFELNYRNHLFTAVMPAIAALSLNTATAYTGLIIVNAVGSGVIASFARSKIAAATVAAADAQIALAYNTTIPTAFGTAITINRNKISTAAAGSLLTAFQSATLVAAPTLMYPLVGHNFSTAAGFIDHLSDLDMAGDIILYPGCTLEIVAVTTAISVLASLTWAEYLSSVFPL